MKQLLLLGTLLSLAIGVIAAEPSIWIMGDSTTALYSGKILPRAGWGVGLAQCVKDGVKVENYGRGGRSTKSYIAEKHYDLVKKRAQKGDFVFIQFGHNDGKKDREDLSAPADGLYQDNLKRFVTELRELGLHPILVTPVSRCSFRDGKLYNSLSAYPEAARQVAAATGTPCVDLNAISMAQFSKMGETEARKLFMVLAKGEHPNYPDGSNDTTHFNQEGALAVARWVVEDCRRQQLPVAALFKE